jgi:hypothetical protein
LQGDIPKELLLIRSCCVANSRAKGVGSRVVAVVGVKILSELRKNVNSQRFGERRGRPPLCFSHLSLLDLLTLAGGIALAKMWRAILPTDRVVKAGTFAIHHGPIAEIKTIFLIDASGFSFDGVLDPLP